MRVRSTRGDRETPFLEAVDRGLAPDGGLYMPVEWPRLPDPPPSLGPSLADTAAWAALHLLEGVLPAAELQALVREALDFPLPLRALGEGSARVAASASADGPDGVPGERTRAAVSPLDVLELFHGPTLAFKDVGARFLARLWSATGGGDGGAAGGSGGEVGRTVLVATSGDTGGAVAHACHGLPGLRVVVLFPAGRVSRVQRHQFSTLGGNVLAVAVDGPFDRCQALAKEMLADPIQVAHLGLTSANSINIGRLVPQVFYYLHLARLRGWGRESVTPTPVVVPSGNLGNVTAGVMARAAGAPLGEMIAACNHNDALVRYLADGETVRVPVEPSTSTAMDVGEPSNLERLFHLFGTDPESLGRGVRAVTVPEPEVARTMRWAHERWGEVLDPHTAVGVAGARALLGSEAPATVLATAHPAKFPEVIRQVLGIDPPDVPRLTEALSREERVVELTGGSGHLAGVIDRWIGDGAG